MTLAITSIAVTAIIWAIVRANASDADLLVASFMPFSLDLGMSHRRLRRLRWLKMFLLGTPLDDIRFDDSPVTEYRQCENRLAIRREFGSEVADLCAGGDVF
jgi:hypothetical protein